MTDINLLEYDYNMRFAARTDPKLLNLAKQRGFGDRNGPQQQWVELFNTLFFSGGEITFRKDIPDEGKKKVKEYLYKYMQGFASDHYDKQAICSMLLSEIVKLEKG